MINSLMKIIVNSPFYPHWLEVMKKKQADHTLTADIKGDVLEVGAGDGSKKTDFLANNKKIKKYLATDYSELDGEFESVNRLNKKWGKLSEVFYGYKERIKLDGVCSATELPYKDNSFDYHLSFEVLEHIDQPSKYFSEASRVLKPGGKIILSSPFLYRMHGGEPDHKLDYYRYAKGFFFYTAKTNNLKVVKIFSNTGFGTTQASLTNQWFISCTRRSPLILKLFLLILSPIVFFITNIMGLLIDIKPDTRFSTRFHVMLRKEK